MKIKDLMTKNLNVCDAQTSLSSAAMVMWDGDCGILPVVDEREKVIGVITDRDLAIAMATKNALPADVRVGEISDRGPIATCAPEEDINKALSLMKEKQIRRLPVINEDGRLEGIISINDLIRHCQANSRELSDQAVLDTLKAICSEHVMV